MKALSIRQPWAHLIVHGPKRIENRKRPWHYRGEVAIHSSKSMTRGEYLDVADFLRSFDMGVELPAAHTLTLGAIVGVARIILCLTPGRRVIERDHPAADSLDWWDQSQYGIVLSEVRPLARPVPCSGMLGLWTVPPEVERQVRGQLR